MKASFLCNVCKNHVFAIIIVLNAMIFYSGCIPGNIEGPKVWSLSGKISLKTNITVAFDSGLVKIGAFPVNASNYQPVLQNISPDAGIAKVGEDSSFSLEINTHDIHNDYIMVFIWYDYDDDDRLDANTEQYSQPFEQTEYRGTRVGYMYNEKNKAWEINGIPSEELEDLQLVIDRSLIGSSALWRIQGKIFPVNGYQMNCSASLVKVGAFQSSAASYVPEINKLFPKAGSTAVEIDSTFELLIDATTVTSNYIHLFVWYDANSNGYLDALTEHYGTLQFPSLSGSSNIIYKYASSSLAWVNVVNEADARDETGVKFQVTDNIIPVIEHWRVKGHLRPSIATELNLNDSCITVGVFSHSQAKFTPNKDGIIADAGKAIVGTDSSFSLNIDISKVTDNYIYIFSWYDANKNGKLDVLSEPFSSLHSGSGALSYFFKNLENQWVNQLTSEPAEDIANQVFQTETNLVSGRFKWELSGSVKPASSYAFEYGTESIKIGFFGSADLNYNPGIDDIVPIGGMNTIGNDSTFSVSVDLSSVNTSYLFGYAWYDTDDDNRLDATKEPFGRMRITSLSQKDYLYFLYDKSTDLWKNAIPLAMVDDWKALELVVDKSLISSHQRWTIHGMVNPLSGETLNYKSGRIMIGGFSYKKESFTPGLENIIPDVGSTTVGKDSSFTLKLDVAGIQKSYIHIFVWYDEDNDGKLDAVSENHDIPVESELFGGQQIIYKYNAPDFQWELSFDGSVVNTDSEVKLYVDQNLTDEQ